MVKDQIGCTNFSQHALCKLFENNVSKQEQLLFENRADEYFISAKININIRNATVLGKRSCNMTC